MKKYKHKNKVIFLLHMLLIASCLIVTPLTPSWAGFETIEYTPDDEGPNGEPCSLSTYDAEAIDGKWWEKPLDSVLTASVQVGNKVFDSVKGGADKLLLIGLALWLALFTLKVVGSMTESDPMENLTKIGGMMIKLGVASWLLNHRDFFFEYFVASVVQAGAGFVASGDLQAATGASAQGLDIQMSGGGLQSVADALKQMAESIHDSIAKVIARANFLQCIGKIHQLSLGPIDIGPFQDPKVWASGCAIWLGAQFFMVAFPFFLIDACFRLGVVAALCPLFIVAWVFPATRGFAGQGWKALLNVAFTFMMIRLTMLIAIKLLTSGSGLDEMEDNGASKKRMVCIFRWFSLGSEDVCEGENVPDTNSLWVYLVCVVYGLLLLKTGSQLAGFFSGANFSDNTAFQAAKGAAAITERTVSDGVKLAGAAKDRVQKHRDRSAARTYEKDQRAREAAKNGGPAYNPTPRQQKKLEKAKKRLQSQRVGALTKDGKENGEAMAKLLENGKARTAMRIATFGRAGKNYGSTYAERTDSELQTLKAVGRNSHKAASAKTMADTAAQNMAQRKYDDTPQGKNQQLYDQMMVDNLKKSAAYKQRCVTDPSFSKSEAGMKMDKELASERSALNDIKKEYGCDDKILDPNFNAPAKEPSVNFSNLSSFK